jgi:hypothetical protein
LSIMLTMSINVIQVTCPNCGAPLEGLTCEYCDTIFKPLIDPGYRIPDPRPELIPHGLFEVTVGETRYAVLGELAQGEHSRVFLARRAQAVTEQVVIKVTTEAESVEREWDTLRHLQGRNSYLDHLIPQPISLGEARGRAALVYRWRSGFVYTLAQARAEYPEGVDAAATVWMWNRILDQLACLRGLGYSHGDLRLEHLLVHPPGHGVAFCGWGRAGLGDHGDVAASGRCILELLGRQAPRPLLKLAGSAHHFDEPSMLQHELKKVAEALFGPPRFRPFALHGASHLRR